MENEEKKFQNKVCATVEEARAAYEGLPGAAKRRPALPEGPARRAET